MERIDLSTNSKKIQESYQKVVRGDATYVVYSVDKNSTLTVDEVGEGDLNEFVENFTDGSIQFGLARVTVPGSDVSKNLLLGWCPDNSPAKLRLSFAANFADVSKVLSGYHVQITARDQDDLDVDEFLNRVGAAAGARYSINNSSKGAVGAEKSKPVVAKPSVAKPSVAKPSAAKPSYVPKSTGNPIAPITPKPKLPVPPAGNAKSDDGWGDEKEIEERDLTKNPLSNVPSSYKPTKVNIAELRLQKSDTTSSTPKPFQKPQETKEEDSEPKSLSERMATYKSNESDGRMTSLPKPKVSHAVSSRFTPVKSTSNAPTFGAKPVIGNKPKNNDGLVGGLSRNFGAEGGKTPAQLWAEKRGQYKVVKDGDEEVTNKLAASSIDDKDEEEEEEEEEEEQPKPSFVLPSAKKEEDNPVSTPARNLPPPPVRQVPVPAKEEDDDDEEDEEEQPQPSFVTPSVKKEEDNPVSTPARNLPPPPVRQVPVVAKEEEEEEEEEETPAPSLPSRAEESPVPSLPTRAQEPTPSLPSRSEEPKTKGASAVAEYDYEKDDDNEIGFEEGDEIVEIDFVDKEWWSGKHVKSGEVGLFPAAYVVLDDKKESGKAAVAETSAPAPVATPAKQESKAGAEATAEYDYEKDEDNEIAFAEGDLIVEIEFIDEDWWSGKHAKSGEVGLFPANYVKLNE